MDKTFTKGIIDMTEETASSCDPAKFQTVLKNKPGRPRSSIPLAERTALARQKRKQFFASHPAEAEKARTKRRAWQRQWRRKNIKRLRIKNRLRYWRRCAKNPNHLTMKERHAAQRKFWSMQPKKWPSEAARCRAYRIREGEKIRIRDRVRRAAGIKNLEDWFVKHLIAKSTGLKRRSISPAMIRRKRKALLHAAAKKSLC
jgi:hypothetical protein